MNLFCNIEYVFLFYEIKTYCFIIIIIIIIIIIFVIIIIIIIIILHALCFPSSSSWPLGVRVWEQGRGVEGC